MLESLFDRLDGTFGEESRRACGITSVRYIFVDDGSMDGTAARIARRAGQREDTLLVRLSRNFGHQGAVTAGLNHCDADFTAVMDADLQDPPELIPAMIERAGEGFDVVYAQRRRRKEWVVYRFGYWAFYRLISFLAEIPIPHDSGDFCVMSRRVVEALHALPERQRFPRGLRAWVGFPQTAFEYDRPPRQGGQAKYGLRALYRLATDGIAAMSTRPLKAAQLLAFCFALVALVFAGGIIFAMLARPYSGTFVLLLGLYLLVALTGSMVMICLYILGAYVGRDYLEDKGRPPYIVMETIPPTTPVDRPTRRSPR